ncbi:Gfo/Idh/MocA family oxidoreductase [Kitasatospora sp. NPDC096077]|uniref:Gfo/Idh/MocA family protein n=1 Tax=Kitasatospora sp. NPDC096077 TaxID=3155544 RepID=UPI00331C5924
MKPLRLGVMGCAEIARRRMLPAMAADERIELVAVASRDGRTAAETARPYGCRPVTGYAELLGLAELDAVYVPLPAALHAEWVAAALDAGKHVLAEKPLTTEVDRTRELVGLAERRGLVLMENVMFVHHPGHEAVRRLVADGAIGELRSFRAAFTIPALPPTDIRHRPELGGGALWDVGVYPLRAALHFLGDRLQVLGATLETVPGRQVETGGAVLLRTPEGVTVQLEFGMEHAYRSGYELVGSTGRIALERAFTPPADHRPVLRLTGASGTEEIELPAADQVALTLAAFTAAVRAGAGPAAGDCLAQAGLLDAVRRAAVR